MLCAFLSSCPTCLVFTFTWTSISVHRGPAGKPGEGSFAGTFERKVVVYLGSFFDPEVNKILCLGATAPMI